MNDTQYIDICEQVPVNISLENYPEEIVFERIPIKRETILDIIDCGLFHMRYEPSTIFIGPDELMDLTGDYRWSKISSPNQTQLYFKDIYRHHGTLFGVDLVIVPHMKGVLII